MKHFFISFFLISLSLSLCLAASPQLLSSSLLAPLRSTLLDQDSSYALLRLSFDQPLFLNELHTCPYQELPSCPPPPSSCTPCDFTDPKRLSSSPSSPCRSPPSPPCCAAADPAWCAPSAPFIPLSFSAPSAPVSLPAGSSQFFRFYLPPSSSSCPPVHVRLSLSSGSLQTSVSNLLAEPDISTAQWSRDTTWGAGMASVDICPNFDPDYRPGTYAVGIYALQDATFTVTLLSQDPSPPLSSPAASAALCAAVPPAFLPPAVAAAQPHVCLPDSQTVEYTATEALSVPLLVPVAAGCHTYAVYVSALPADALSGTDADLYCAVSDANGITEFRNTLVARFLVGSDALSFSLCAPAPTYMRCMADILAPGRVVFRASSGGILRRLAVSPEALSPFDYTLNSALSAATVVAQGYLNDANLINLWCASWSSGCDFYWNALPSASPTPLFPPSSSVYSNAFFEQVSSPDALLSASPAPGRYLLGIRLDAVDLATYLAQTALFFWSVSNADGETLALPGDAPSLQGTASAISDYPNIAVADFSPASVAPECDPAAFAALLEVGDALSASIADIQETAARLDAEYQLDLVSSSLPFVSCLANVSALLPSVAVNETVVVKDCPVSPSSPDWVSDPCCNPDLLPFSCCLPQAVTLSHAQYAVPDPNATAAACRSGECASAIYEVLSQALSDLARTPSSCSFAKWASEVQYLVWANYETNILPCQTQAGFDRRFRGLPCSSDADCDQPGTAACDLVAGVCSLQPQAVVETAFLSCFIQRMDPYTEQWIRSNVLGGSDQGKNTTAFLQALAAAATIPDCLGASLLDWRARQRFALDADASVQCLTTSCTVAPNEDLFCSLCDTPQWEMIETSEDTCHEAAQNASYCAVESTDPTCAQPAGSSCVFCPSSGEPCIPHPGQLSASACASAIACVLVDGTVVFDLTAAECAALASCNVECPIPSCKSFQGLEGVCQLTSFNSQSACQSSGFDAEWYNNAICIVPSATSDLLCAPYPSSLWYTCAVDSLVCANPSSPKTDQDLYLQCFLDSFGPCATQAACEATGACSDRSTLQWVESSASDYVVHSGACVNSGFYQSWTLAQNSWCVGDMIRTTNGCIDPQFDQSSCPNGLYVQASDTSLWEYKWMTPALTEAQCLDHVFGRVGCRQPYIDIESRFLWLITPEECLGCSGFFSNIFTWTPGVWQTPAALPLRWVEQEPLLPFNWTTALSFQLLDDWSRSAQEEKYGFGASSESICRYELLSTPLSSLVCDCVATSDQQQKHCYPSQLSPTPVGLGVACFDQAETFQLSSGQVYYDRQSISRSCTEVTLSTFSTSFFTPIPPTVSVSFRLATVQGDGLYTYVVNTNEASIGTLAGPGINMNHRSPKLVDSLTLCLLIENPPTQQYHVRDFGRYSPSHNDIHAMGFTNITVRTGLDNNTFWCSEINPFPQDVNVAYFPIYTIPNPDSSSDNTYSSTSLGLVYTLGALYSVDLFLVMIYLVRAAISYTQNQDLSLATIAVFFLACLCVFRIVYTFSLESGVITDSLLDDFVVFELPTFFYFTAVSFLLGAYLAIGVQKGIPKEQKKIQAVILLISNLIVWALFVSVVVAVGVIGAQSQTDPSVCPGILPPTPNSVDQQLQDLRLAYQSIIIALCGILTIMFLVSLYLLITKAMGDTFFAKMKRAFNSSGGRTYRTVTILTLAFMLRCILFIIILAAEFQSVIYMFITLLITEVLAIFLVVLHFKLVSSFISSSAKSTSRLSGRSSRSSGNNT